MRRCKAFFGGDVRLAVDAISGSRSAAGPQVLIGKPNREVGCAVRSEEAQRVVPLRIQEIDAPLQVLPMTLPVDNRIVTRDARGTEDCIPQLAHGKFFG